MVVLISTIERQERIGKDVGGGTNLCIIRETGNDFVQSVVHLICCSFKEPPTAPNKECVSCEQRARL